MNMEPTVMNLQFVDSVKRIAHAINKRSEPDWEQRSYEIAKDVMGHLVHDHYEPYSTLAQKSVKYADALIEELKRGNGYAQ